MENRKRKETKIKKQKKNKKCKHRKGKMFVCKNRPSAYLTCPPKDVLDHSYPEQCISCIDKRNESVSRRKGNRIKHCLLGVCVLLRPPAAKVTGRERARAVKTQRMWVRGCHVRSARTRVDSRNSHWCRLPRPNYRPKNPTIRQS